MKNEKQNRRQFLQVTAAGLAALGLMKETEAASPVEPFTELSEITVLELQAKMKSGELSAKTLVEQYIARITEIDPKLHSVLEINPDAVKIAEDLDKERKKGKIRSMMHGIPVLIKDNIDTADKMKTTAGSLALFDAPTPKQDAFVAAQLRKAGAVILGKTNLSEWANFRSTKSTSGWSGRGGQTNNPYVLDKNPCGSSAGTGAAISANLAAAGVGTETNGSIICPSLRCGLVGIKPTLGLISRSGIIPISHSQDTAGPMARCVSDAAVLLGALAGIDRSDVATAGAKIEKDYTKFLDKNGLKGAKIGVARQFVGANGQKTLDANLKILQDAGATLIEVTFPTGMNLDTDETTVLQVEFKAGLNKYLAARNASYKTLADLIKFNDANKDREMPLFGQEIFTASEARPDLTDAGYLASLKRIKLATQNGIDDLVTKNGLDAFVSLSGGASWGLTAISGYPYITVPAGMNAGLPTGFAFFGRAFSEPQLIKLAYAFEQLTKMRETPKLLPTLPA